MLFLLVVINYIAFFVALLIHLKRLPIFLSSVLILSSVLPFLRLLSYQYFEQFNLHFTGLSDELFLHVSLLYLFTLWAILFIFRSAYDPILNYVKNLQPREKNLGVVYFIMLYLVVGIMLIFSGSSWIHGNREATISISIPWLRYVYPSVLFLASIVLIHSLKMLIFQRQAKGVFVYLVFFVSSAIAFMLIGQRGILIVIVAAFTLLAYKTNKLSMTKLLSYFILIFLFGVFSRSVTDGSLNFDFVYNLPQRFVQGGDGTQVDSLTYSINYLQQNGINFTLFYEVLTVLGHQFRIDTGLITTSDILNTAALGDSYYDLGYGYNFGNISILLLNFSYAMPLIFIVFLLLYRRLVRGMRVINWNSDSIFIYYLITQLFISSIGSIHWLVYTFVLVILVRLLTLILVRNSYASK
jgi:hypothetical protein